MTSATLPARHRTVGQAARRRSTGGFRRLLLILLVIALPLEHHLPAIGGFSVIYLAFAVLTVVALVSHPGALLRCAVHPIFIAGYFLIAGTFAVETLHSSADLLWWSRMAQMIAGAVVLASYLRTDREIQAVLTGYVLSALWVAAMIVRSSYAVVISAGAASFDEASLLRQAALEGLGLNSNWNMLAMLCASGAAIASARAIVSTTGRRMMYTAIALFLLLGMFMTFSRGGMLAAAMALGYVFLALLNRKLVLRMVPLAVMVVLLLLLAVPRVVFQRFEFSFAYDVSGNRESRAHVYGTLIRNLPEYLVTGVGSGNYWSTWAYEKGLSYDGVATGAHNLFLQVTAFWGLMGLVGWLVIFALLWIHLRRATRHHLQYVPVTALLLVITLLTMLSNDIGDKQLSVLLGTVTGLSVSREWARRHALGAKSRDRHAGSNG